MNNDVRVTYYRNRHGELNKFSIKTSDLVSHNNVEPLLLSFGVNAIIY